MDKKQALLGLNAWEVLAAINAWGAQDEVRYGTMAPHNEEPINDNRKRVKTFWNDSEGALLWVVLSALRGPDDGDPAIKEGTTAAIRPVIEWVARAGGALINPTLNGRYMAKLCSYGRGDTHRASEIIDHFEMHIRHAAKAIVFMMEREGIVDADHDEAIQEDMRLTAQRLGFE